MSRKVFEYFFDPEDLDPLVVEGAVPQRPAPPVDVKDFGPSPDPRTPSVSDPSPAAGPPSETNADDPPSDQKPPQEPVPVAVPIGEKPPMDRAPAAPTVAGATAPPAEPARHEEGRTRMRRLLSVHALGQYVFCPRSAILAAENGDDRDADEPPPRLTFLPNFDRERIEETLSTYIGQLGFLVVCGVCLLLLMRLGLHAGSRWVFYPSLLALLGLAYAALVTCVAILDLTLRRRAALRAEAGEPAPEITRIAAVNWWSLLAAGFAPVNYPRPFQHPELPLEGAPWRVLERGSLRIPVIRSGGSKLGPKRGELYAKHEIRLAAYALLLEAAGHWEVPYGLLFPVDSPRGLALPITSALRERARRLLIAWDQQFEASQRHGLHPPPPENRHRCGGCQYGQPLPIREPEVARAHKAGRPLVVLRQRRGDLFHCACGDRFNWMPPHRTTVKRRLTATVE